MTSTRDQIASTMRSMALPVRGNAVVAQDEARHAVFAANMGAVDAALRAGTSGKKILAVLKVVERFGRR